MRVIPQHLAILSISRRIMIKYQYGDMIGFIVFSSAVLDFGDKTIEDHIMEYFLGNPPISLTGKVEIVPN